jgi:hypothetical protein
MSWFESGSACRGNKEWKCWYQTFDGSQEWCRDYDNGCPSYDSGGGLVKQEQTHPPPSSGGGGWH